MWIEQRRALGASSRVALAVLTALVSFLAPVPSQAAAATSKSPPGLPDLFQQKFAANADKIDAWYVYTGTDNESHLKKITFDGRHMPLFGTKDGLFKVKLDIPPPDAVTFMDGQLARVNIYSAPANFDLPLHRSPGCEMFLILRGSATYLGKDGVTQEFRAGDLVIFEDTTGPGHAGKVGPEGFTAVNFGFVVQGPISTLAKPK